MIDKHFLELAEQMRQAQSEYFAERTRDALIRAKRLENEFDDELRSRRESLLVRDRAGSVPR